VTPALTRVLVDTDVFSAPLDPHRRLLARQQAPRLAGRIVCVAAQTVAELRFGAIVAGWGRVVPPVTHWRKRCTPPTSGSLRPP